MSARPDFESLLRRVAHLTTHPSHDPLRDRAEILAEAHAMLGSPFGPFELQSVIGVGGMGVVFAAWERALERRVALKVTRPDLADVVAIHDEARRAAALDHPSIGRIHSVGRHDGIDWIAMELVAGITLRERLARGTLPRREAIAIARDVAAALGHAHARGLVHRDVKPENTMLRPDGRAVLLDFGLAAAASAHAVMAGGTPRYQPSGRQQDRTPASMDLHALGMMLFEMLTGTLPPTDPAAIERHVGREPGRLIWRCIHGRETIDADAVVAALEGMLARPRRRLWLGLAMLAATSIVAAFALGQAGQTATAPLPARLTARVDDIPIALAAIAPDASKLAWVDAHGLTIEDLAARSRRRVPLPEGLSFRYGRLHWSDASDHVSLVFYAGPDVGSRILTVPVEGEPQVADSDRMDLGRNDAVALTWDHKRACVLRREDARTSDIFCFVAPTTARLLAPSPDAQQAVLVTSSEARVDRVTVGIIDLRSRNYRALWSDRDDLLMSNDQVAVAWRGNDHVVIARYEAERAGGNLFEVSLADGAERRLTAWRGLHPGHLSIAADGRHASFIATTQQTDIWVGKVVRSTEHRAAGSISAREIPDAARPTNRAPDPTLRGTGSMQLQLHEVQRLTVGDGDERPSAFSRDGREVLGTAIDGGIPEAMIFPLETTGNPPRRIGVRPSTWPTTAADGTTWLWRHDRGAWHLARIGPEGMRDLGTAVEGGLTSGRPGPPGAMVRCASRADMCWLGRMSVDGSLAFARVIAATIGDEIIRGPGTLWAAGTRWELAPDGTRVSYLNRNHVLTLSTGDDGAWDGFVMHGPDACWPQYVAPMPDGGPLIATVTCIGTPAWRMIAIGVDGIAELRTSDQRWLAHPVVSPDGRHLAWSERVFQTDIWLAELPP